MLAAEREGEAPAEPQPREVLLGRSLALPRSFDSHCDNGGDIAIAVDACVAGHQSFCGNAICTPRLAEMMRSKTRQVDGVPIRWEEDGGGFPVVFVHGIPTSPDLWRHVVPRVENAHILAFEMVGYGDSIPQGNDRDISVSRQADYLLSWLSALEIDRAILVGHDLGGGVVQIAAVRNRAVAAGLLLTNSIGYDSWPIPSVKMMRAMGGIVRHLPSPLVKAMIAPLFPRGHDDSDVARESLAIHWSKYEKNRAGAALIRQMRSLDVNDTLSIGPQLPSLSGIPSRVIWGAADPFQPVSYGERFANDLGTKLERIEGGKHFTPEDHPEQIARGVNELLREVGKS